MYMQLTGVKLCHQSYRMMEQKGQQSKKQIKNSQIQSFCFKFPSSFQANLYKFGENLIGGAAIMS